VLCDAGCDATIRDKEGNLPSEVSINHHAYQVRRREKR